MTYPLALTLNFFAVDYVCYREIKTVERYIETSERHCPFRELNPKMGHEISACQMQHDAADK